MSGRFFADLSEFRGAKHLIFRVDAEDLERLEAKVDQINRRLEQRP